MSLYNESKKLRLFLGYYNVLEQHHQWKNAIERIALSNSAIDF